MYMCNLNPYQDTKCYHVPEVPSCPFPVTFCPRAQKKNTLIFFCFYPFSYLAFH